MENTLKPWQKKVQCRKCDDIIWSKYAGEFVTCSCGAIFCDQTPHYSRYGGNPDDFIYLEDIHESN